jgi:hypothetical protein
VVAPSRSRFFQRLPLDQCGLSSGHHLPALHSGRHGALRHSQDVNSRLWPLIRHKPVTTLQAGAAGRTGSAMYTATEQGLTPPYDNRAKLLWRLRIVWERLGLHVFLPYSRSCLPHTARPTIRARP